MKQLTQKQRAFVERKAAGVTNREAAIAAGYSSAAADVTAAKLLRRVDIKAAISTATAATPYASCGSAMPIKHYAAPIDFLEDVMNNLQLPIAMRIDAAKSLLPYRHAKLGEKGKKEQAKERAHDVASWSRFSSKSPPKLHAFDGK